MKTVRELADEIGVSKVAVIKKIERLNIKNDLIKKGNRLLIPDSVEYAVKVAFNYSNENKDNNDDKENEYYRNQTDYVSQTLIEMLRMELEEKNKQIENLQTIINQEQRLRLISEQKVIALEKKEEERENNEKKQGFWGRLFGTKPKEDTATENTDTDNTNQPNEDDTTHQDGTNQ